MENWLVINKLIILIYIAGLFTKDNLSSEVLIRTLIALLLYIIINLSKAIVSKERYKNCLKIVSLIGIVLCYFYVNINFVLLLPICMYEVLEDKIKPVYLFCIFFIVTFSIEKSLVREFILIALFTLWFNMTLKFYYNKYNEYKSKLDELEIKNSSLLEKLNNQKEYRKQLEYNSQLEERNKIAQEIHDKLGHNIAGSIMQLEAAKLVMEQDKEKSKAIIENTIQILRTGMESIRATLKNIKPNREQMGFNQLKLMMDEFNSKSGISTYVYHYGDLNFISVLQWKVIYDNVQEALTNIMKYSEAKNVKLNIQVLNKLIKIEVKDDGRGCKDIINGIGFSGMEERCLSINGKLIIDGSEGFSVIQLFPIEK